MCLLCNECVSIVTEYTSNIILQQNMGILEFRTGRVWLLENQMLNHVKFKLKKITIKFTHGR